MGETIGGGTEHVGDDGTAGTDGRTWWPQMSARQVNHALALCLLAVFVTGVVSWGVGTGWSRLWTVLHAVFGIALVLLLPRETATSVRSGLRRGRPARWISVTFGVLTVVVIVLGTAHSLGIWFGVGWWSALWTHTALAFVVAPLIVWHVWSRPVRPRRTDLDRRFDVEHWPLIAWSHDGGTTTNGRVWVADADGTNARAVNSFQSRFAPARAPDGSQLAMIGNSGDGDFDLFVAGPDGSGATKLADTPQNETDPTWGTFGLAVVRGDRLVVVDATTGADVTSFMVGSASGLDAHPTAPLVAMAQAVVGGRRIAVLDVSDGSITALTDGTTSDGAPAWSPDGTSIAFNRAAALGSEADLWVMDADGSGQLQLTSGTDSDITPDWHPNSAPPDPASIVVEPSWGAVGNWTTVSSVVSDGGDCAFPAGASIDITWDELSRQSVALTVGDRSM